MTNNEIKAHYASPGLYERILQGVEAIGKSPASVDLEDLAAVDEFHLRGPAATRELIEILDVGADSHVLDVGSGLGGPARRLATATGCRVTGVDLSEDYCAVGNKLTGWLGLSERVRLEPGDATRLERFAPSSFDAAWSIHVGMNVEDKGSLYASVAHVLKPGAPFVLFDILSAGAGEPTYPAPWAATLSGTIATPKASTMSNLSVLFGISHPLGSWSDGGSASEQAAALGRRPTLAHSPGPAIPR